MIRLAEWANLSSDDQLKVIAEAKPNGAAARVEDGIRAFEEKFGFASDEMMRRVKALELRESWEVCQWLSLLHRRDILDETRT